MLKRTVQDAASSLGAFIQVCRPSPSRQRIFLGQVNPLKERGTVQEDGAVRLGGYAALVPDTHLVVDAGDELELLGGGGRGQRLSRHGQLGQLLLLLQLRELPHTSQLSLAP